MISNSYPPPPPRPLIPERDMKRLKIIEDQLDSSFDKLENITLDMPEATFDRMRTIEEIKSLLQSKQLLRGR